jgi:hypothetical protein
MLWLLVTTAAPALEQGDVVVGGRDEAGIRVGMVPVAGAGLDPFAQVRIARHVTDTASLRLEFLVAPTPVGVRARRRPMSEQRPDLIGALSASISAHLVRGALPRADGYEIPVLTYVESGGGIALTDPFVPGAVPVISGGFGVRALVSDHVLVDVGTQVFGWLNLVRGRDGSGGMGQVRWLPGLTLSYLPGAPNWARDRR